LSNLDHHDRVLFRERHCVALIGDLVEFHASGDGSRGHEIFHHATVPEFVLDGLGVVWASLLKELLEVVHQWPRLAFALTYGSHDSHHTGATCLLVVATIIIGRGCSLLKALLVPHPTILGPLPDILESDIK
jgi:hypothetical protein